MAPTSGDTRIQLPGFGLPLEQSSEIPTATGGWWAEPVTVRERTMIALMATIKDKPDWSCKVFDNDIVAKWRSEALEFGRDMANVQPRPQNQLDEDLDIIRRGFGPQNGARIEFDGSDRQKTVSERMFDYCIAELRDAAESLDEKGMTAAIDAEATVYMSDTAVSLKTKRKLRAAVTPLEDVPEAKKDWHPGSDSKVVDLVHPSLCPLVYGKTRILSEGIVPLVDCHKYAGKGETIPMPERVPPFYSRNFQWLPCEVSVDERTNAKITSYINNLHPCGNEDLYSAIAEVITQAMPLWTASLVSTLFLPNGDRMESVGDGYIAHHEDFAASDSDEVANDWESNTEENYVVPEPKAYGLRARGYGTSMNDETNRIQTMFREKGMQVIVKLANIHLTPEKPTYDGGSWHVEGKLNEHICASALYYYDEKNISPSYLAFRESVRAEALMSQADQHREYGFCAVYGIEDHWGDALQVLGKIRTREDRLLVFPNVLQHRVSPFELEDPSKPGHRKLLALFLVDPNIKVPSTANVPPQQAEWFIRGGQMESMFRHFPNEIADQIVDELDFPFTTERAKSMRLDLIKDRGRFQKEFNDSFPEDGYCFCEH